jgi:hypothetical protein
MTKSYAGLESCSIWQTRATPARARSNTHISSLTSPKGKQTTSLAPKSVVDHHRVISIVFCCLSRMQVHGVERHNMFVSLAPGVEHLHSVELPPRNVQRCYEDVEDDHEVGLEQVLGRVQAPLTNRRRGPEAPRHKRAQKTRLGNAAIWCVTGQRTKRGGRECLHAQPAEEE